MKRTSGFTIVEIIVVVIVLGILIGMVVLGFSKIQADARDSTRLGNITAISEAFEKYYSKNGEYPSIAGVVSNTSGNTGDVVAAKLGVNASDLKMPQAGPSVTNSLVSNATPANDAISYTSTDTSATCQTNVSGGCTQFTLKYIKENGGLTTITGRQGN